MQKLTYADIKQEFDVSLGYVRQDIRWLLQSGSSLNYTVALLIGCGCEMLAAAATLQRAIACNGWSHQLQI